MESWSAESVRRATTRGSSPGTHLARERNTLRSRSAPQDANDESNERAEGLDKNLRVRVGTHIGFISYEGDGVKQRGATHIWRHPRAKDALHLETTINSRYPRCT